MGGITPFEKERQEFLHDIGKFFLHERLLAHLTQAELCKIAGISQSYLSKLENGKGGNIPIVTIFVVAKALNKQLFLPFKIE